jgi:hypothetical protein
MNVIKRAIHGAPAVICIWNPTTTSAVQSKTALDIIQLYFMKNQSEVSGPVPYLVFRSIID